MSRHLKYCVEERKTEKEIQVSPKTLDAKSIMPVQICYRCGRKFPFKKRRKRCPYCQGILRTNTVILKVPQF